MRILNCKTINHPILGDCSIDFSQNGNSSNVVLIAGANGSGKTTLLNEIFALLNDITPKRRDWDIVITFALSEGEVNELQKIVSSFQNQLTISSTRQTGDVPLWTQIKINDFPEHISQTIANSPIFFQLIKIVYSTVEINFSGNQISTVTSSDIDTDKSPKERSSATISKQITQLLVDIKTLDNQDAFDWMESHNGKTVQVNLQEKRIDRFRKAFELMIEGKKFEGVKNEKNHKKVYFKDELGNEIDISDLSTGEKQIVFRAGYLLKNLGTLVGGIVLIDEPELSLHPAWQEKYIKFVESMFSNRAGIITTQIIIATHSPFIIQNSNITDQKIIILEKQGKTVIESSWPKFYGYTQPSPVFIPMPSNAKPLLLVEGKTDKRILSVAWTKLYPTESMYFDIKWAGEPNSGGATKLQRQLIALAQHANEKILGLFDADFRGLNDYKGTQTNEKSHDFTQSKQIGNLKILKKVGVTYLPAPTSRAAYFNITPQYSSLTLELFFSDKTLNNLNILTMEKIMIANIELVKIKEKHDISEEDLNFLPADDFEEFRLVFQHIKECFNQII